MTRGTTARAQRRTEREPLPPALRAELRARVAEAAERRDQIVREARRQKKITEQAANDSYERIRRSAQDAFERERDALREDVERRAAEA